MQGFALTCCAAAVICAPMPAAAEAAGQTSTFSRCMDLSGGVTVHMLDCMAKETALQDARLNQAYKALMASLPKPRQRALQHAQRAWLAFRTADCQFLVDPGGGSAVTLVANDCFMTMTTQRAQTLEDWR